MKFRDEAIILLICILCYGHTLKGNFVFDDTEAIINNKDLNLDTPLNNILKHDFWGTSISSNASHKSYRPVTVFVYRCIVELVGFREPIWFHTLNLILYTVVCLQYYKHIQILANNNIAFPSAVLFAVHPIHTEVIASVVGCADLLCSFFYYFGLICFYKAIINNCVWRYTASLCFMIAATFSKEIGLTAIGVCLLLDLLLALTNKQPFIWRSFCIRSLGLIAAGISLLYIRCLVMNFTIPVFQQADNPASFAENILVRFFTYSYLYAVNGILLLWPQWLCFDWSMGCIPLIETHLDARIIVVVLFWVIGIYYLYKSVITGNKIICFALGMIGITFLPATNLFFRVGFVIAERILFLPSAGHCLLVTYGYQKLCCTYHKYKTMLRCMFWFLIIIFGFKTHTRASEWLNENDLFNSALDICPKNAKVHYNVAKVAADIGNLTYAENEYRLALKLYPNYDQAMNNLANILRDRGQLKEAKHLLKKAVKLRNDFAAAWMNLGIVLATLGEEEQSEYSYNKALQHRKNYSDCYYNLGNLYLKQNRTTDALTSWFIATEIKPSHSAAWSNILVLFDNLEQHDKVIEFSKKALKLCSTSPAIYFTTANTLGKLERWKEAEEYFKLAIKFDPKNALYYSNFGVLYHRWGNFEKAKEMYNIALKLQPQMITAARNLNRIP